MLAPALVQGNRQIWEGSELNDVMQREGSGREGTPSKGRGLS